MRKAPRGVGLVEAMVSMVVLLVGALGVLGLYVQGQRMNGDATRMTRATAIADDLRSQIELWAYTDPRLAKGASIDAALGDPTFAFERSGAPAADHGEADLTLNGAAWLGLPSAAVQAGGYERYWNVAYVDDGNGNGVPDDVRIAVIVRWPASVGYRRVVLLSVKPNPVEAR